MGRLVSWPVGIGTTSRERLTGPRAVGASATESATAFVQTTASPYGLWRWAFSLPPLRGAALRRWRGTVAALHGGANALRVPWRDPDRMSMADAGVAATTAEINAGTNWSNGLPWTNGRSWRIGRPLVSVAAAASRGATSVSLGPEYWGHDLELGDELGFVGIFALHTVTAVLGPGTYRIWPPLRADLTTSMWATLEPVLAMRPESESAANLPRGPTHAEGLVITLVEVEHRDVIDWFSDAP